MRFLPGLVCLAIGLSTGVAGEERLINPTTRSFVSEPVRVPGKLPQGLAASGWAAELGGRRVPLQVVEREGVKEAWILAEMEPLTRSGVVLQQSASSADGTPSVRVERKGGVYEMSNGRITVRVPAEWTAGDPPPPVLSITGEGAGEVGRGSWHTERKLERFEASITGNGTVFAQVTLRYHFEGKGGELGEDAAFYEARISLLPLRRHADLNERYAMGRQEGWEFDVARGWKPTEVLSRIHGSGAGAPGDSFQPPTTLAFGQTRLGGVLMNLIPRWTQSFDDGWFFAAADGGQAVGAMSVRAGRWVWPHDSQIQVRVKESADFAGLFCPTWKGARSWFLLAGPRGTWEKAGGKYEEMAEDSIVGVEHYVRRYAFEPLDKLNHDYLLSWPGRDEGGRFRGEFFFSSNINPTGPWRGLSRNAIRDAGKNGDYGLMTHLQTMFDPDCFGDYPRMWSPINPNFYTDFKTRPIALAAQLREHPDFEVFKRLAVETLKRDLIHSVTLPGGAGQECPGYTEHALSKWEALAPLTRKAFGFDPTETERFKAARSFFWRISVPDGAEKRIWHPGGDTHPGRPEVSQYRDIEATRFKSEEFPGFGVVLRNRPGTERETYFAFKSGPNRGHYHGDQLSFHYAANARRVAVDHHCSYRPRAGQEHMHNRVTFFTDNLPWANMDGHERVIAFKPGAEVDIVVGQVESARLRETEKFPPEKWDHFLPQEVFDRPLVYRRTVVLVKGDPQDYFVIRDQFGGPELRAAYCLHVYGETAEKKDNVVAFDNLQLLVAAPSNFTFERHDWSHDNGGIESTKGVRLLTQGREGEFITVLYPGGKVPEWSPVPGGVKVGGDEIVFSGSLEVPGTSELVKVRRGGGAEVRLEQSDIDLNRSQGDVGLFVPSAGYPFGDLPEWLIRQRVPISRNGSSRL